MKWHGIRRGSIDIGPANEGLLAVNTRFKVEGEMRRRRGLARTNLQKRTSPVDAIAGFSPFQRNVMSAMIDGDKLQGDPNPYSLWGDNPSYINTDISNFLLINGVTSGGNFVNAGTDTRWPASAIGGAVSSSSLRNIQVSHSSGTGTVFSSSPTVFGANSANLIVEAASNYSLSVFTSTVYDFGSGTLTTQFNPFTVTWRVTFAYPGSQIDITGLSSSLMDTPVTIACEFYAGYAGLTIAGTLHTGTAPTTSPPWNIPYFTVTTTGSASFTESIKYMSFGYQAA